MYQVFIPITVHQAHRQTDRQTRSHRTGREDIFIHRVIVWFTAAENKHNKHESSFGNPSSRLTTALFLCIILLLSGFDTFVLDLTVYKTKE